MEKIKNKIKILIGILTLFVIFLSFASFAYYTNIGSWLDQQRNVYVDGEGQKRLVDDFIEDGCGTDTMLDTVTGLCWDKNFNRFGTTKSWTNAVNDCNALNHAGHTDWYLAGMVEYFTLFDHIGELGQTCLTLTNIGFINCQDSPYWTKTTYSSDTTRAYYVYYHVFRSGHNDKTITRYFTCVRRN